MRDIHIEVALLAIIVPQLVQVVFELVILETARTREPREHPPFLRLHLTFQLIRFYPRIPDEADIGDLHLGTFFYFEDDRAESTHPIPLNGVSDGDLIVTRLLVILDQLARVVLYLAFIEREIGPGFSLLFKAVALDLLVALELDREDAILRRDLDHEIQGVRLTGFLFELDQLKKTRAVERAQIAVEHIGVELAPLPDLHVRAHDLLINVGRSHKLDRNRAGLEDRGRLLRLFRLILARSLCSDRSSTRSQQQENGDD